MAKLEEIEDSDEEEPPKADEPKLDFNDMLKKAADMKTQALKEKRRLWENAPEWLKNTMELCGRLRAVGKYVKMHERQGDVKEIRETKSIAQRLEAASKYKDKGNELFGRGKLEKASAEYVKAIALFQLFMRNDKREEIWLEKQYEKYEPADRSAAEKIMVGCFTNLAMILLKQDKAYEAVYACNLALEFDPLNVKALYRRGLGRVGEDTSTSLELAVKDLEKAMKLAPVGSVTLSENVA